MRNDKKIILRVGGKKKTFTSYVNDLLFIGDNLYPLMFGLFLFKVCLSIQWRYVQEDCWIHKTKLR